MRSKQRGNEDDAFTIQPEHGSVFLARRVDWETKNVYNLTVQASDGVTTATSTLLVTVVDTNDHEPVFTQHLYHANISESVGLGTPVLRVSATDQDRGRWLLYTIESAASTRSLDKFRIGAKDGVIVVAGALDREDLSRHLLTVMVRDKGVMAKRSFARVQINLLDHNDHVPRFLTHRLAGRVYETAAVGTSVLQVEAVDQDKGENGRITYDIVSGNADNTFTIDPDLGILSVAKPLDRRFHPHFDMVVVAMDHGMPALSNRVAMTVDVTVSSNSPPRFAQRSYVAELSENMPAGTVVLALRADSLSTVTYRIVGGDSGGYFNINPNSGVVSTARPVDFEQIQLFNLTVTATSIVSAESAVSLKIHILDVNDNAPEFSATSYSGSISEAALQGSMVLAGDGASGSPLVIQATDRDSGSNARLFYEIPDLEALRYFAVDPNTGAIRIIASLDHEKKADYFFTVQVRDKGDPQLQAHSVATVTVYVLDVNDCPPRFDQHTYRALLLLPTYPKVRLLTVEAMDQDSDEANDKPLRYSLSSGNEEAVFSLDAVTGILAVKNDQPRSKSYYLGVAATDGKFTTTARISITVQQAGESTIKFTQERYTATVPENKPTKSQLVIIQPINLDLGRHVTFTLLNNHAHFSVGRTSGVLSTTGLEFDREQQDSYTVVVKVDDTTERELSAHVVVQVNITDENDNLPMFVKLPYHCTVSGEAKQGEVIQEVQAVDSDLGENGQIDYRLADSLGERFAINPYTREIIVKRLSREDHNKELILKVIAQDRGLPSLTAVASVHIHVTDSNSPLFEKPVYTGRVVENAAMHTAILPVTAVSPHGQKLLYSISRGDKYGDFALDFNIGFLSVVGQLDYEMKKTYSLVVRATDIFTGSYAETKVNVEVEDVNDNPPVFTSMAYSHTLPESTQLGGLVLQVQANDSDSGANAVVYYQLAPVSPDSHDYEHFQMDPESGKIILRKALDHETQSEFTFLVIARDGGIPSLNATTTVKIKVLDLNDNAPVFTQLSYDCYISDQATRGQLVFKVVAFDPDDSDVGNLAYSIVDGDEHSTFSIDGQTGAISLSEQRNPTLAAAYTLNVSVSDGVYTSFCRVTVDVRNSNSHTPAFYKDLYVMDVTESSPYGEGHVLVRTSAEDPDRGNYGMLTYSIMNDDMKQIFSIDADTGEIISKQALDREEKAQYSFQVSARDNGGRTGYATVLLRVRDVNDHAPQFIAKDFRSVVFYNASVGTPVLKIEAQDEDEGDNARLVYNIHQDPSMAELFDLNADTGELITKKPMATYENKVFQFFVRVTDQGNPPLKSHVPVEIMVLGRNDKPPRYPQEEKLFIVDENEQVGTIVATVRAEGPPGITYSLVPGYTNATNEPPTFTITSRGGLQLRRRLDRETTPMYSLTVRAQTDGSPPLVDHMRITVQIRDVNDNPPRFSCSPYEVTVPEDAPAQHQLIQLQASDKDKEVVPLRYALGPGTEELSSIFALSPDSGWVTLLTPLDREARSFYNLSVLVWDTPDSAGRNSDVSLTASTSVLITVTDVNDNAPTFQRGSGSGYATAVNEGALPGTVLLTLETEDVDSAVNSDVTFYITEGDHLDQFELYSTGELLVNRELDREVTSSYRLRIAATDGAHVSYTTVTVDVLDDNDNVPVCDKPVYQSVVNEDVTVNTMIVQVKATDADDPTTVNSKVTYSLKEEESYAGSFEIDSSSGVIRTAQLLDRETAPELRFIAVATDGGGLTCSASVIVLLKDVNDNIPVFPPGSLREAYNIKEDAKLHTLLTRVAATDADIGINSQVRYGLNQENPKVFEIDPDTGIISLVASLDREQNSHYELTVTAHNLIAPDLSSKATLWVDVLDVNDNPPEFERSNYLSAIEEFADIGTVVTQVQATSLDIGVNADILYSLVAGNEQGKFTIDAHTGKVMVAEPLDHELSSEYFLTVLATDQGSPPLTASTVLSVNITDVNDNSPRFSQGSYTQHVSEAATVGTEIFRVMATDSDSPQNAKITYSIFDGDSTNRFIIDPHLGIMQVNAPLDREKTASYSLVIQAHDSGVPVLSSTAVINIIVDDANDNPPSFSQHIYRGLVQEGRRTGIEILTVSVTDVDLPENGRPFHFEIVEGNKNGEFHIDSSGLISTAGKLSKHVKDIYNLTVRAHDSGEPSLSSDAIVEIAVVNDSLHAPEVKDMSINIRSCSDNFFGGVIGRVKARDLDPYDKIVFTIVSPNSHLFDIHRFDGRLIALTGLDAGHYVVNASVSDGKFTSYAKVDVHVVCTSKEMLASAVTIQFDNLSEEQFYSNFRDDFRRVLKHELGVRTRDVEIINVQPSSESLEGMDHVLPASALSSLSSKKHRSKRSSGQFDGHRDSKSTSLDVLFAVRKSANSYYPRHVLKRKVKRVLGRIESKLGVAVADVFGDICEKDSCDVGSCIAKVEFDESTLVPVTANGASFVSARHRYIQKCVCLEGDCAEQVCGDTTCTANTVCQRNAFGDFVCQCPEGRTGHNCEDVVPLCSGNSCPIERPMTFAGKSYAKWRLRHSTKKRFSLRLRVRTRQTTAVLMYAKGKVDYSILKIERGSLVYKFDCGSGEGHVRIPVALSDGQWHTIKLERNGREAELSLDAAYTALGIAPGIHAILNVDTEELFFGAEVDVFPNGYHDIGHGFEGCMEDIRVFDIPLPFRGNNLMAQALEFEKVKFHCQDYPARFLPGGDGCSSSPCLNGGQCKPSGINAFKCTCPGEFRGRQCELNPDPCQQRPCLGGGRCEKDLEVPNSYLCHCPSNLMGSRCSYGSFCRPNPCLHEGTCVEGPNAPLCDCKPGFEGLYCEKTVNPCDSSPCHHGGNCHSMGSGAYFCNCTAEFTGKNCELTFLVPGRITSSSPITLYYILGGLAGLLFIVLIIVISLLYCRRHRRRREKNRLNQQRRAPSGLPEGSGGLQGLLSGSGCLNGDSSRHGDDDSVSCGGGGGMEGSSKDEKLRCKLSNPDLTEVIPSLPSQPPPVPTRPASYTPSTHDSFNALNNLDGVRDYGSAADELENSGTGPRGHIPDFYQYVEGYRNPIHSSSAHPMLRATPPPPLPHSRAGSESDSIQKQPWEFEYPNFLENYMEGDKKHHNKVASKQMPGLHSPHQSPVPSLSRRVRGHNQVVDTASISSLPVSESEDDFNAERGKKKGSLKTAAFLIQY
ncbi:fat cadherin [Plakobranchus ocellatus]|uniref:Fat cadherin n=1 Tax=Plakobranchus ocellatus TaxID=259542 RepID=A0AAV3XY67_9GAST|nr:fat cadherin [Plakobranchus ocellatus]